MLIYYSPHNQCLGNHILGCPVVGIGVTDDLIDLGTGDGRAEKNEHTLYHAQGRGVRYYMAVYFFKTLTAAQHR